MSNYNALIIDDESLARFNLRNKLEPYPQIEIVGEAASVNEAVERISELKPDLLFLDIQLGDGTGFDLLNQVEFTGDVIFVTAYDEFAIRAFEINALDYLMKPVSDRRLKDAIDRLLDEEIKPVPGTQIKIDYNDRLMVTLRKSINFVKMSEIAAITASREYSYIYTNAGKEYLTSYNITEWENRLPDQHFCRIHRSTIVNFDYIAKITPNITGTAEVVLQNAGKTFIISRSYFKKIKLRYKL